MVLSCAVPGAPSNELMLVRVVQPVPSPAPAAVLSNEPARALVLPEPSPAPAPVLSNEPARALVLPEPSPAPHLPANPSREAGNPALAPCWDGLGRVSTSGWK